MMKFQELVSITGLPGLYQLVATKSDGAIVRSIDDNTTKFVAARSHSVTALDGIEVFTTGENMRLFDVFLTMKNNTASAGEFDLSKADSKAIKEHYAKLFPEFDADKVYVSDMKKMIKWCAILDAKGLLVAPTAAQEAPATEAIANEEAPIEKPKKEKAPKAPKAETEDAEPKAAKTTKKKAAEKSAE
jgi:Domain of unknown function (DUF5606)